MLQIFVTSMQHNTKTLISQKERMLRDFLQGKKTGANAWYMTRHASICQSYKVFKILH